MYNYLRIKLASTDLVPVESGYFDNEFFPDNGKDDYVASVRDYRPYEAAANKNKQELDDIYGFNGGLIGGLTGIGLGWYGTDALVRNTKWSNPAKATAKAVGAIGLGALGDYAGDAIGRQLSPGVVVEGAPTIPITLRKKTNKPFITTIDTNFTD